MGSMDDKRAEKRKRIVEAAAGVFSRRGYKSALMAEVATAAGVGKGTIYEYFDSKEELFLGVFDWFCETVSSGAMVRATSLGLSTAEKLTVLCDAVLASLVEHPEYITLTMEFWAAATTSPVREKLNDAFRRLYADYRLLVTGLIDDGIQRGEFRSDVDAGAVAAGIVAALDALPLQSMFEPDFNARKAGAGFVETLLAGLSAT